MASNDVPGSPLGQTATPRGRFWGLFHKSSPKPSNLPPIDGKRELVETIVFVIVLVLLLKSFVAEAFVIPTGSMAETLLGYNKVVRCPECGVLFPVNASSEVDPQDGIPWPVRQCQCPNCREHIYLQSERHPATPGVAAIPDPGWTSGDRVLVGKYFYDLVEANPRRLDVVVFKYPGYSPSGDARDIPFPKSGPFNKNHVPINYIKRLIGLPGETIAICNGKLYVLPPEKSLKYDDLKDADTPEDRAIRRTLLWEKEYMHVNDPKVVEKFRKGEFEILRKAPEHLLAMKRLVYDNDHPAKDLKNNPEYQRWRPEGEKSWQSDDANGFRHAAGSDESLAWLRYHHRLRDSRGDTYITPFMGYNTPPPPPQYAGNDETRDWWVGDLILECEVTVDKPEGELVLELSKGPERYQAHWNLADGLCTLYRLKTEKDAEPARQEMTSKKTALSGGKHRVRFANVDQRLTVWVDGKLIFGDGEKYEVPAPPHPTANDLQPASIGVKGGNVHVQQLRLDHDTFYSIPNKRPGYDGEELPVLTMYVQPDHFLCLGDNSFHSSDSRSWGTVPRRLLLGRALTVYYPFYFPWWPFNAEMNRVGLIH